ncbi:MULTISPECIES: MFS transporter [Giesbergeria]|uniref:MFS transporter n=1 Tax=Giesbergeria sinuosa TaxID=80883 RepID=A0ABV9QEI2_9BURK
MPHSEHPNQFALLRQRRFAPFFWTQFAGAANDNLFKFAFTVLVTYQLQVAWLSPTLAGLVIGALFILPFLLFSATAGQLTDKFEKTRIIRFVKSLEIAIMLLAGAGFMLGSVGVLLLCTFLMGVHSTLFGPVKFAYLPQALNERELTGGNGMIEMGTFVAILLGNVAGGLLVALPNIGPTMVALACLGLALAGRVLAQFIPAAPATDPHLQINWNPISETWRNLKLAHGNIVVFRSLLGISWMWFFGAVFLAQFPSFARDVLHGDAHVASLLLVVFSVGIGTGSLLCEVLSRRHVEIGLVPLGAIGMTVFAVDLYAAAHSLPTVAQMGVTAFVAQPAHWRVMLDLLLLSLFAGLYSVPMYALIQMRSQPTHRARIIAANNILNALFMIASSVLAGALLGAGWTVPEVFLATGLANAVVAGYIFLLVPEYLLRFIAWVLSRLVYHFKVKGDEHLPTSGAAILVCNHAGFVDRVLLMAASPRPICFVVEPALLHQPWGGWLLRLSKAIAWASGPNDALARQQAQATALQVLREGDLLAVTSEQDSLQLLAQAHAAGIAVSCVPLALHQPAHAAWGRVQLQVGAALAPTDCTPQGLRQRLDALRP